MRRICTVIKDCTLHIENAIIHSSTHEVDIGVLQTRLFFNVSVIGASVINRSMKSTSNLFVS